MHNPVGWFEIYVQDMPRAKAFYEAVLGVTLNPMENPSEEYSGMSFELWGFPWVDGGSGAAGALVKMDGMPSGGGGTLVYFSCADCAVEAAKAAANGGALCKPKTAIGKHGFFALVTDTEGNMIGLHSMA